MNPNSPFDSTTNTNTSNQPNAPKATVLNSGEVRELFQANRAASQHQQRTGGVAPAQGYKAVPGYEPSGRVGGLGMPLLLLSLVVVPLLGAILYNKLGDLGGFAIFSAVGLGLLMGLALYPAIQLGKVRNVAMAALFGFLVGAIAYVGAMGLEAWGYRAEYAQDGISYFMGKGLSQSQAHAQVEAILTPSTMMKMYWQDRALSGIMLSSSRTHMTTLLTGNMFWAYEGLGFLLATLFGAGMAMFLAGRRYSEEFDRWFITKKLGGVYPNQFDTLIAAANAGDWARIQQMAGKSREQVAGNVLVSYLPEKPGGLLYIQAKTAKNGGVETLFEQELSNEEMKTIWPAFPMPNHSERAFAV